MTDAGSAPGDSLDPEEAFGLIGDEIRAEILRVLSVERGGEGDPPTVPFADLRRRAAPDVDSSQFNYHLQRLVGHFVEKREDGYELRPQGTVLTRTVRAGAFSERRSEPDIDLDLDCHFCGSRVTASYEDWLFEARCPGCDYLYDLALVPPGVLSDEGDVLSRINTYSRHRRNAFADGVCHTCGSAVGTTWLPAEETGWPRRDRRELFVLRSCDHCGDLRYLTVGELLLRDPALVGFCRDRGLDVREARTWDLGFAMTDRGVTVRSRDPWGVALEVRRDGDAIELVVDESLRVVDRSTR